MPVLVISLLLEVLLLVSKPNTFDICRINADTNCVIVTRRVQRSLVKMPCVRVEQDCPSPVATEGVAALLRALRSHLGAAIATYASTQKQAVRLT
jgi:hypothetical protein